MARLSPTPARPPAPAGIGRRRPRSPAIRLPGPSAGPGPWPRKDDSFRYCRLWRTAPGRSATQPTRLAKFGQTARASRSTPGQVARKVRTKSTRSPADSPTAAHWRVRSISEGTPVGIERVEGTDERIAGKKRGILLMQQEGKAIGLVAIEAVIPAQGEIQSEDQAITQPSVACRRRSAGCRIRPEIGGLRVLAFAGVCRDPESQVNASRSPSADRVQGDAGATEARTCSPRAP